ncbi:hypothetical protein [Nonomuraea sp. KM90]
MTEDRSRTALATRRAAVSTADPGQLVNPPPPPGTGSTDQRNRHP